MTTGEISSPRFERLLAGWQTGRRQMIGITLPTTVAGAVSGPFSPQFSFTLVSAHRNRGIGRRLPDGL